VELTVKAVGTSCEVRFKVTGRQEVLDMLEAAVSVAAGVVACRPETDPDADQVSVPGESFKLGSCGWAASTLKVTEPEFIARIQMLVPLIAPVVFVAANGSIIRG
jgi:hypothetical protein